VTGSGEIPARSAVSVGHPTARQSAIMGQTAGTGTAVDPHGAWAQAAVQFHSGEAGSGSQQSWPGAPSAW
jgi:hypothetical protein